MSADAEAPPAAAESEPGGRQPGADHPEWLSLDEGEELRWVGQPASVSLVPAVVWGVVLLPVVGLGLLIIVSSYLSVTKTDFVATTTTLYHKRGVLSTNIESVGLDRIQNTEYSQSFSGTQLGYGTIQISTAGSSGSDVTFQSIEDPRAVRTLINELTTAVGTAGGTGGRASTTDGDVASPPAGGVDQELLAELLTELRAVNESMRNVERLLREERAESDGASGTSPDTGRSGTASEFVSGSFEDSTDDSDGDTPSTSYDGHGEK